MASDIHTFVWLRSLPKTRRRDSVCVLFSLFSHPNHSHTAAVGATRVPSSRRLRLQRGEGVWGMGALPRCARRSCRRTATRLASWTDGRNVACRNVACRSVPCRSSPNETTIPREPSRAEPVRPISTSRADPHSLTGRREASRKQESIHPSVLSYDIYIYIYMRYNTKLSVFPRKNRLDFFSRPWHHNQQPTHHNTPNQIRT